MTFASSEPGSEPGSEPASGDDLDVELAATDPGLASSLAQLLAAPADLERRTQTQVTDSLLQRSFLGTASDVLTVGWRTIRFLVSDPPATPTGKDPS